MAPAFGVRALGTALVVISGFYRLQRQEMRWAAFPTLPKYQCGLPKRSQAPALQRLAPFHVVDCIQLLFAHASLIFYGFLLRPPLVVVLPCVEVLPLTLVPLAPLPLYALIPVSFWCRGAD